MDSAVTCRDDHNDLVLIADDDPVIRTLLTDYLENCGLHVASVGTGHEALEFIDSTPPAVLLLDMKLPDMTGMEILRSLRNGEATRHLPTVVISADCAPTLTPVDTSLADGVLPKPFNLGELHRVVRSFLDRVAVV